MLSLILADETVALTSPPWLKTALFVAAGVLLVGGAVKWLFETGRLRRPAAGGATREPSLKRRNQVANNLLDAIEFAREAHNSRMADAAMNALTEMMNPARAISAEQGGAS